VGWTGLKCNYRQLAVAAPAIEKALVKTGARFMVIADAPPPRSLARLEPEYRPWRPETEVEDLSAIDIGVMPLPDTPYTRGKCSYKLLQYMAMGMASVASPVGMNCEVVTPGVDGLLPKSDEEWTLGLIRLIEDPVRRADMGLAARNRVVGQYSQAALYPRYLEIFSTLGVLPNKLVAAPELASRA
jgi:glycosyltransferase involved in cell wall biosynthesis